MSLTRTKSPNELVKYKQIINLITCPHLPGRGRLASVDAAAALASPGVVSWLTASDIPGVNNVMAEAGGPEVLFVEDQVGGENVSKAIC